MPKRSTTDPCALADSHEVMAAEALAALGDALSTSMQVVCAGLRQCEATVGKAEGQWKDALDGVARWEDTTRAQMQGRHEELEAASNQRRAAWKELQRKRCKLETRWNGIEQDMWEVIELGSDRVPLDVGGQRFEASAWTLRKWFAERLDGTSMGRRLPISLDRNAETFKWILSYLRAKHTDWRESISHMADGQRKSLLDEAHFFGLTQLAGILVNPAVGSHVKLSIPSSRLEAAEVESVLAHDLCGSWHVPGRCFNLECRQSGAAFTTATVVSYDHCTSCGPKWTVRCHGHCFQVEQQQLN